MAGGLPEPTTFPAAELAAIAADAVREHTHEVLGYGPVEGLPELRDALATRFSSPDLTLTRENVFVTSAGMQGLDLVGKVLVEPGQLIACQFPTYLGALDAWRPRSPAYRNIMVDDPAFDAVAAGPRARCSSRPSRSTTRPLTPSQPSTGRSSPTRSRTSPTRRASWWVSRHARHSSTQPIEPARGSSRTTPTARCTTTASHCLE